MPRTGRPRSFDEDVVVHAVRDVFWRRGFGSTSVQDLVDRVGLERSSLYGAFGDKRRLLLRAVDDYVAEGACSLARLTEDGPVLPRLRALLVSVLDDAREAPGRGCLLGNTAVELAPHDAEVTDRVRTGFQVTEDALRAALDRAREQGEVRRELDVPATARMVLALMQGLQVVARTESEPARLSDAVDAALAGLR